MADHNSSNTSEPSLDYVCYFTQIEDTVLISVKVELVWSLIAVVVGLVANSLNIAVFTSQAMRTISSNVYLLNLAISDSMYLLTVFLAKILTVIRCLYFFDTRMDIYNTSNVMCRLLQYMLDLFSDYSVMMILAFTVERFIACYHAMRFKELCTVWRSWVICISLLATIGLSILPYHMACIGLVQNYYVCTVLNQPPRETIFFYAYIVEMMTYRIIPIIVIAVLNVFIIFKICHVHKQRRQRHANTHINKLTIQQRGEDKHIQLTIMLITVSTTYIVLLIPNMVYFIINRLITIKAYSMDIEKENLFKNYTSMFFIAAFAVNFFLYTMGGKVFRDQLKTILCIGTLPWKKKSKNATANGNLSDETQETLI